MDFELLMKILIAVAAIGGALGAYFRWRTTRAEKVDAVKYSQSNGDNVNIFSGRDVTNVKNSFNNGRNGDDVK